MPELPEVENVRKSISQEMPTGYALAGVQLFRKDLRFKLPEKEMKFLIGSKLLRIERRGKYLLFIFEDGVLASHLGMTGRWRVTSKEPPREKHDHVQLQFFPPRWLTYNDARRFGYIEFIKNISELSTHPLFEHLGLEPLSEDFNADYLVSKGKMANRSVKVFLMDQSVVVGVGNIYVSEVLFLAKMRPTRKANSLMKNDWIKIAKATKGVLKRAIKAGGSSIRDYRNGNGEEGSFQGQHKVYGKAGEPCSVCKTIIKATIIGGRSTFWCPSCQK